MLVDSYKNLYQPIIGDVKIYFSENNISWWGGKQPTGHVLSSQIACLNHLYPIRSDKYAVLQMIKNINDDFIDILEIHTDKKFPAYIQFEAVSDRDHLNEGNTTRGNSCTSIDALIYALHKDGTKWLIPIEWKYTEFYGNENKLMEGFKKDPINCKGEIRRRRYTDLINNSKQLTNLDHRIYYYEPFYQLMRQTLWAEQMVLNKDTETLKADNYLHIHVIPKKNKDLLEKRYPCNDCGMESTWRANLIDQSKYLILSPEDLLSKVCQEKYEELTAYLSQRYWN